MSKPNRDYPVADHNEWIYPYHNSFGWRCCDCQLVHQVDFRIVKSPSGKPQQIKFRARRDERATVNSRRGKKRGKKS